jgi:hypothetical protein
MVWENAMSDAYIEQHDGVYTVAGTRVSLDSIVTATRCLRFGPRQPEIPRTRIAKGRQPLAGFPTVSSSVCSPRWQISRC